MARKKGILERVLGVLEEGGVAELSREQTERLEIFVREVVLWSGRMHLLGKRDIRSTLEKQVLDSFLLLEAAEKYGVFEPGTSAIRVADVGSGSGFPGIIWKIVRPALDVTLFERKTKPFLFLERVISLLGMEDLEVIGGDAMEEGREACLDIVVSKAAGRLSDMLPVARRLLREGGAYVTVKGARWEDEVLEAKPLNMFQEASRDIPGGRGVILLFRKQQPVK